MNLFYSLPIEIQNHVYFFVYSSYTNSIINAWRRYFFYKRFIIHSIDYLPKFFSFIDNDLIFYVCHRKTYFLFKKLFQLTTGNESYLSDIYSLFYNLAVSVDDYEWANGNNDHCYSYNKYHCISIAYKFNWYNILEILN